MRIYSNPGYGSFEVALEQDSLFAPLLLNTWWLRHIRYDVFDPYDKDPKTGIDNSESDNGDPILLQFGMDPAGLKMSWFHRRRQIFDQKSICL